MLQVLNVSREMCFWGWRRRQSSPSRRRYLLGWGNWTGRVNRWALITKCVTEAVVRKEGEQIYLSISTAWHSTDIHIMLGNIQNERKGYSKKRDIDPISKGRPELSCLWPSMPGQTLKLHFLSNREPKASYQQGGAMTDFTEKDGLKETESKGNELRSYCRV